MVPYSKLDMKCVTLLASSLALAQCQCKFSSLFFCVDISQSCFSVRFNLGDIFGRPNRNQDQNQNENQNNGGRVDAGAILGGLLGAVKPSFKCRFPSISISSGHQSKPKSKQPEPKPRQQHPRRHCQCSKFSQRNPFSQKNQSSSQHCFLIPILRRVIAIRLSIPEERNLLRLELSHA